ncbi:MAG: SusF/SusE family outer membrane protein [Bacteroidales bacterium]|nr:SusF/SusE family outer membrane protein [Bacteroidales bacterium]
MRFLASTILAVVTFATAFAQQLPFTNDLYMIGGATPNGWDNTAGIHLTTAPGQSGQLTWIGELNSGDFKFILTPGTWMPAYNALCENQLVSLGVTYPMVKNLNYEVEDHKFTIPSKGTYKVTVDLSDDANPTLTVINAPTVDIASVTAYGSAVAEQGVALTKENDYTFVYEGALQGGVIRFALPYGQWIVPVLEDIDILDQGFFVTSSTEGGGWRVTVPNRRYRLTLDFLNNTLTTTTVTPPTALYLVGGATKIGWSADAALEMPASADNPWVYTFNGVLRNRLDNVEPTSFKILAQLDWGPTSYHPVTDLQNVLESTTFVENGDDFKWTIDPSQQGYYTITIDLEHKTMSASFDREYTGAEFADNLYMIGGATEAGWITENAIPMVRDENDPSLFTFTGDLRYRQENEDPRQFKILGQRGWGPYSLHSTTQDEDVLTSTTIVEGGDDNKWSVPADREGIYTITVNLNDLTIHASLEGYGESDPAAGVTTLANDFPCKITALNGTILVDAGDHTVTATLINLQGRILDTVTAYGTFTLGHNLPSGFYLVATSLSTHKILLQ